ncbi:TPA: glycosyltransferase family 8 protein, partial [Neisseria gonorrhoeae]
RFIDVNPEDFAGFPLNIRHISITTYARLKLGEYIADCDKVLYLDTDVLVRDGLKPLWDTDLGGNWVGACIDLFVERQEGYKQKIGMADGEYYFNAGVLLINLKKWRRHDIFKMSCEWVEQYKDVMQYQDQDILNGLFKGGVCYANSRFNFMPTNYAFMANGFASRHTDPLYLDRTNTAMPVAVS